MKSIVLLCSVNGAIGEAVGRGPPPRIWCHLHNSSKKQTRVADKLEPYPLIRVTTIDCLALTSRDKVDASGKVWQTRGRITTPLCETHLA